MSTFPNTSTASATAAWHCPIDLLLSQPSCSLFPPIPVHPPPVSASLHFEGRTPNIQHHNPHPIPPLPARPPRLTHILQQLPELRRPLFVSLRFSGQYTRDHKVPVREHLPGQCNGDRRVSRSQEPDSRRIVGGEAGRRWGRGCNCHCVALWSSVGVMITVICRLRRRSWNILSLLPLLRFAKVRVGRELGRRWWVSELMVHASDGGLVGNMWESFLSHTS